MHSYIALLIWCTTTQFQSVDMQYAYYMDINTQKVMQMS